MTREDIIAMAREAFIKRGFWPNEVMWECWKDAWLHGAFAEREECERGYLRLQSLMEIRETQPNKPCCLAEREACAKVAEEYWEIDGTRTAKEFAEAIRARSNT